VASLTHAHRDSVAACVLWSLAIEEAITSADPVDPFDWEAAARRGLEYLDGDLRTRWTKLIDEAVEGPPERFNTNGWVVTAFQAALAAIIHTPVPEEDPGGHLRDALVAAVRIGDDTDTVAAIAGGLLGACWGASAVPDEWWQVIHGSRRNGSPQVGVLELERLALAA
jgi:ADP-ribosylglycohydrolase